MLILNKLRWRYGHRWLIAKRLTREHAARASRDWAGGILLAALLLTAQGIVDLNDRMADLRAQEASAQEAATKWQDVLVRCLNGRPTGLYEEDSEGTQSHVFCDKAGAITIRREDTHAHP